ncbi:unnamed protein product [Peronospora effusa]|nr:unnamed protein product [Peronospora effusa]
MSEEFWWPHLYRWVANYIRSCEECQRIKPAPSNSAPLKPLPIPTECWKSVSLDFMFGLPPDHKGRTGLVVFVDRLSKMVHLTPCSTKISGKEATLLFLDHVYRLYGMPESIVSDRDPRFTSVYGDICLSCWVASSTCQPLIIPRPMAKQKGPIESWRIVHASTGETPFYINGLRHPRTPVSFVRSPSLSGGGHLTSPGANDKKGQGCPSETASLAVFTSPIGVTEEARTEISVLLDDDTIVLSTASTHERPLGGVIGELDAKSVSESQRFVDERLAITRNVRDAMASAQDKQKQYANQHGRKNNEHFSVGDKVL